MSNGINALIAQGGTQVVSPIERYQQVRKDTATERRNALAERQAQLGMQQTRQSMQQSAQTQKMAAAEAYGKAVTPIIESVNNAPDKQAAWMTARPQVEQMAATMGIDMPPGSMEAWNQQQADTLISRFGSDPAKGNAVNVLYQGRLVNAIENEQGNYIDERTGATLYGATKAPTRQEAGEPGAFTGTGSGRWKFKKERADAETQLNKHIAGVDKLTDLVASDEFLGGVAGDINAAVASATAQFRQATGEGSILNEDGKINWNEVDPKSKSMSNLRKRAINTGSYEATVIEMAYLKAKAVDPSSKITDKDFAFAKKMIQAGADKAVLLKMLQDERAKSVTQFNREEQLAGRRYKDIGYQARKWDEGDYRKAYGKQPVTPEAEEADEIKSLVDKIMQGL